MYGNFHDYCPGKCIPSVAGIPVYYLGSLRKVSSPPALSRCDAPRRCFFWLAPSSPFSRISHIQKYRKSKCRWVYVSERESRVEACPVITVARKAAASITDSQCDNKFMCKRPLLPGLRALLSSSSRSLSTSLPWLYHSRTD